VTGSYAEPRILTRLAFELALMLAQPFFMIAESDKNEYFRHTTRHVTMCDEHVMWLCLPPLPCATHHLASSIQSFHAFQPIWKLSLYHLGAVQAWKELTKEHYGRYAPILSFWPFSLLWLQ
jgi:hypothetical protein